MKVCDHTSVGMLIWKDEKLLLIERKQFPLGYAASAGHVEKGETYEEAAKRELKEEIGLNATDIKFIGEVRKENPCRYPDGTWHYWKVYSVIAEGDFFLSEEEVKQIRFFDKEELVQLNERTKKYLRGEISESDWQKNPGLQPIWSELLTEFKIIK